ncbi:MAG: hypothetical protein AB8F95_03030 [Bacteroidia bacterium]
MFIYRIILEPALPLDIWSFKDAPVISQDDAHFIYETFPFEEPEIFEEEPELGPAPHIVFGSLRNSFLLMLSYKGKGHFDLTLCKSLSEHYVKKGLDRQATRNLLDRFWQSEDSIKLIRSEFKTQRSFIRAFIEKLSGFFNK